MVCELLQVSVTEPKVNWDLPVTIRLVALCTLSRTYSDCSCTLEVRLARRLLKCKVQQRHTPAFRISTILDWQVPTDTQCLCEIGY